MYSLHISNEELTILEPYLKENNYAKVRKTSVGVLIETDNFSFYILLKTILKNERRCKDEGKRLD